MAGNVLLQAGFGKIIESGVSELVRMVCLKQELTTRLKRHHATLFASGSDEYHLEENCAADQVAAHFL
jgi:phage replication-related protein YjqB (UPF0714/DUF867 family)